LGERRKAIKLNCLLIAEAGVNHNADLKLAFELVDVAVEAGADVVKFQTAVANQVVTKVANKAKYQIDPNNLNETQLEMTKKLHLPLQDFIEIKKYCEKKHISFATTAFDFTSLDFISTMDLPFLKIPSGEITNLPYLRKIGMMGKPIILSTGMASIAEIKDALDVLVSSGTQIDKITVLHCTTSYPVPFHDVNLKAMASIKNEFGVAVGYSDHTLGIAIPIAAVALGASVIEKHFTLDRNLPGPDHKASIEPDELKEMIISIRQVEKALGDGKKQIMPSEKDNVNVVRKSIVARKKIAINEILSEDNITVKRPGIGISPMHWDTFIGKKSKHNYSVDELLKDES
jgi:N,N'-diacetyllegionaminate synthase